MQLNRRIFITGGAGFTGSPCEKLLACGHQGWPKVRLAEGLKKDRGLFRRLARGANVIAYSL